MIKKRREECIVFLDDCFDTNTSFTILQNAGFTVERFRTHFPALDKKSNREADVKDPRVIHLCAQNGYLLLTTDREMKTTFIELLKQTDIAVLATANNNESDDIWAQRVSDKKARILRDFKKCERPYFSIIQRSTEITVETLRSAMRTRRTRPSER